MAQSKWVKDSSIAFIISPQQFFLTYSSLSLHHILYIYSILVLDFFCYNFILSSIADTGHQLLMGTIDRGSLAPSLFVPLRSIAPCTATCLSLRVAPPYALNYTHSLFRIPPIRRAFSIQSQAPRLACLATSGTSALHHPQTLGIRSLPGPCLVVFMRMKFMAHCKKKPFGTLLSGKSQSWRQILRTA